MMNKVNPINADFKLFLCSIYYMLSRGGPTIHLLGVDDF